MKDKLLEMKHELNHLSEEVYSTEREKSELIKKEEEFHFLLREKNRMMQELKSEWKTGEMNYLIHDVETDLNRQQRNAVHEIEMEIQSLNKKMKNLGEKEQELQRKINLSAMRDKN